MTELEQSQLELLASKMLPLLYKLSDEELMKHLDTMQELHPEDRKLIAQKLIEIKKQLLKQN